LAELAAADFPSARAAGERCIDDSGIRAFVQVGGESYFPGIQADQPFRWKIQEPFTGTIHQPQFIFSVERKHRNVDFLGDLTQESGRLDGVHALSSKSVGES